MYPLKYYSVLKRKGILIHASIETIPEGIRPSQIANHERKILPSPTSMRNLYWLLTGLEMGAFEDCFLSIRWVQERDGMVIHYEKYLILLHCVCKKYLQFNYALCIFITLNIWENKDAREDWRDSVGRSWQLSYWCQEPPGPPLDY